MATIDQLQIEINANASSAERAVDNLISKLHGLNNALNLKFGENLTSSLHNLSDSLQTVSDAVNSIDVGRMKDVSGALRSLATQGRNLAGLSRAADGVTKSMGNVTEKARETAKTLATKFNIKGSGNLEELTKGVEQFYNAADNPEAARKALDYVKELVSEYGTYAERLDDFQEKVSKAIRSADKRIPQGAYKEFADGDINRLRGLMGISNTKNNKGMDMSDLANQIKQQFGTNFEIKDDMSAMADMAEYLIDARLSAVSVGEAMSQIPAYAEQVNQLFKDIAEQAGIIVSNVSQMNEPLLWMEEFDGENVSMMQEAATSMQNIAQGAANAAPQLQNVSESFGKVNDTGTIFENIVSGLQSLNNVSQMPDFTSVRVLADSVNKLSGDNVQRAAASLPQIGTAIQSLNGVTVPNLEGLDTLAQGLRALGSKTVVNAANSLPHLVNALSKIQNIDLGKNIGGIVELSNAIRQFGYKSATAAADNIPRITTAFMDMARTLSRAPAVSENTIRLAQAMGQLAANGGRVYSGLGRASKGLNLFNGGATRARKTTQSLASVIGKITATYWLLFRALGKVKQAIDLASDLTEVQNVVDQTFKGESEKMNEFAKTAIQNFGMSQLMAKEVGSRFQAMGTAMEIPNRAIAKTSQFLADNSRMYGKSAQSMADMSIELTKLSADMASFYNKDYAEVAEDMEAIFTGQTRPLRQYGLDLTNATLKQWAMNNGLNANIKTMSQAEKTLLRYQYVMAQTGAAQGDFLRTSDTWANQTRMLKENFKELGIVIGKTFINAFKPAVKAMNAFLQKVTSFAEQVFNALGQIFGWKVEIDATGIADDYEDAAGAADNLADGTGDAAKNAKELNKQLAGFDRLNNLTTPKNNDGGGSGGSGSGAGGAGGGAGGEDGYVEAHFEKIESDIKDLETLGGAISEALSKAMEGIKWNEIYAKASGFGKGLANFMNGLFAGNKGKRLFKNLGKTVAGAINSVFIAWNTWSKTIKWASIGANIKKGVVEFLKTWKPKIAGSAFGNFVSGLANGLYSAVSDRNAWSLLGDKISEGINAFLLSMNAVNKKTGKTGWEALFLGIWDTFSGMAEALSKVLENPDNWKMLIDGIGKGIKAVLKDIAQNPDKLKNIIEAATFITLGKAIAGFILKNLTVGSISLTLGKLTIEGIKNLAVATGIPAAIGKMLNNALDTLSLKLSSLKVALAKGAKTVISGFTETLPQMIASALGVSADAVTLVGGTALSVALGLVIGVKLTKIAIKNKWFDKFEEFIKKLKKDIANFKLPGSGEKAVTMDGREITLHYSLRTKIDNLKWKFGNINIEKFWKDFLDKFFNFDLTKAFAKKTKEKFNDAKNGNNAFEIGSDIFEGIMLGFTTAFTAISEPFLDFFNWVWEGIKKVFGIKSPAKKMKPLGKNIVLGIIEGFSDVDFVTEFKKWLNSIWDKLTSSVTDIALEATVTFDTKKKDVKEWFSTIKKWWDESKRDLKTAITKSTTFKTVKGWFKTIQGWWADARHTLSIVIDTTRATMQNMWTTITSFFSKKTLYVDTEGHSTSKGGSSFATGGVFKNGKWHGLPQFASGGLPTHGSMFVAGEHGSEVVGHIGGQTEVLNQSQLASVMYSAVTSAMAQQNAILIKQNEILTGILSKDYGISTKDIFNATRSEATSYYNRTGRPAFEG